MIAIADGRPPLTPVQADVLEMIRVGCALGLQPSHREMADWLGVCYSYIPPIVRALEKKGYLRRHNYKSRAIEVLP